MSKPGLMAFWRIPSSGAKDIFSLPNVCMASAIALALISCLSVMLYYRKF
jgi:hypothetical protein